MSNEIELDLILEDVVERDNSTTYYFVGGKEQLEKLAGDRYPEADGVTIDIELPKGSADLEDAVVSFSPYKKEMVGGTEEVSDYDWNEIENGQWLALLCSNQINQTKPDRDISRTKRPTPKLKTNECGHDWFEEDLPEYAFNQLVDEAVAEQAKKKESNIP